MMSQAKPRSLKKLQTGLVGLDFKKKITDQAWAVTVFKLKFRARSSRKKTARAEL